LRADDIPRERTRHRSLPALERLRTAHIGTRRQVSRKSLANAIATHNLPVRADVAQRLIGIAMKFYADTPATASRTTSMFSIS